MNRENMLLELKRIITPYARDKEALGNITEETDFLRDLKINSANLVDVVLDVEEAFDIEIENEAMEKMTNVHAAMAVINSKVDRK